MSKILLREKALQLRFKGYTYGQIRRELDIPKSTLSEWLKNFPLDPKQQTLLVHNKLLSRDLAREKYRETVKKRRLNILKRVFESQSNKLLPLSEKDLFIAGLFLYWGEGEKRLGRVSISNTDPRVVKFALFWITKILKVPKEKVKVYLQLYKDMDIKVSIGFWSNLLDLPKQQFSKPYIKKTNRLELTYKNHGYGTCRLYVGNVEASQNIAMSIKAISDRYGLKDDRFWYN